MKELNEESLLIAAEARIARLEKSLQYTRRPWQDRHCDCCNFLYVPLDFDSCRCSACCDGCYLPKGSREWIQGQNCSSLTKILADEN